MAEFNPNERVIYRCGAERKTATVLGACEKPDVFKLELSPGVCVDAHKCQIRKIKAHEILFIPRFPAASVYPDGLAAPRRTLDAAKRPSAVEVLEVRVIRRHPVEPFEAPPKPAFLEP